MSYKYVIEDIDKYKWITNMTLKMESMYSKSVLEFVDKPDKVRPIGCKWLYKRKGGMDEKKLRVSKLD